MAKRAIKRKRHIKTPKGETQLQAKERTALRFVNDSPYKEAIINALRAGTPNSAIAEHFINRGVFTVNQKTATEYLRYYRQHHPQICKPQPGAASYNDAPVKSYDHLFDGNALIVDEETELLRLIHLQKARLGIAFDHERGINMLLTSNRKDVEELRNLIMDLAKLRGLVGNTMDVNLHGYSSAVKDDLKGIQQDETQRNTIATLVGDLARVTDGS